MKKILSVFVLTLVFLFTSVNETQAGGRLSVSKNKKAKKEFQMRGFVFQPINGVKFAVVDDGEKYNIYYSGEASISIICAEEGADVSFVTDDGKRGVVRISEVRLSDKRNKVLVQKVPPEEMVKLRERFDEE